MQQELSILREPRDWLPLDIPGSVGVSFKVYKVDAERHRVVLKVRFAPGTRMPFHIHHCRAVAYTLSGSWAYDEGPFAAGDVAYEHPGNTHTPVSDQGCEMMVMFDSDSGQYLDNVLDDGTVFHIGERFFAACLGATLEEYRKLDLMSLVDILPGRRDVA